MTLPPGMSLRGTRLAPSKYKAVRTEGVGPSGEPRTYDSKAEAAFAARLNRMKAAAEIRDWFPQVSIPYGVAENGRTLRYVADAMVLHHDGRIVFMDRKGMDTPASKAKRAALRMRGIDVEIV